MSVFFIQKLIRCSLSNTKSIPASASSFFLNMSPRSRNASVSAISALITTVCPYWSLNEIFCVRNSIAPEDCDDGDEGWSGIEARGSWEFLHAAKRSKNKQQTQTWGRP